MNAILQEINTQQYWLYTLVFLYKSVNQSFFISQSVSQSVSQLVSQSASQSVSQSASHFLSRPWLPSLPVQYIISQSFFTNHAVNKSFFY